MPHTFNTLLYKALWDAWSFKGTREKQTFPYSVSLVFQGRVWYGFLMDANAHTENYFGILHKSLNMWMNVRISPARIILNNSKLNILIEQLGDFHQASMNLKCTDSCYKGILQKTDQQPVQALIVL